MKVEVCLNFLRQACFRWVLCFAAMPCSDCEGCKCGGVQRLRRERDAAEKELADLKAAIGARKPPRQRGHTKTHRGKRDRKQQVQEIKVGTIGVQQKPEKKTSNKKSSQKK